MRFNVNVENATSLIVCELKDELYHKLMERIDSRGYIVDKDLRREELSEKYREEIEMILRKVTVV